MAVIAIAVGLAAALLFFGCAPMGAHVRVDALNREVHLPEYRRQFSGRVIAAYGGSKVEPAYIVLEGGQHVYVCTPGATRPAPGATNWLVVRCANLAWSMAKKTVQGELLETSAGDRFAVSLVIDSTITAPVSPLGDYSSQLSRKAKGATRDAVIGFLATVLGVGFFLRRWILRVLFG